eukprot:6349034-Pyramimonas_sp.AAC.1
MPRKAQIEDLAQNRALCLVNTLSQNETELDPKAHSPNLYGFRRHRTIREITAGLRQISKHATIWGKLESLHLGLAE